MTDQEWITLIIASIGGDTSDALLSTYVPTFWATHADIEDANIRATLTRIDGIQLLLGNSWRQVDFKALDGASVNLSDMFEHLLKLLKAAQEQLTAATLAAGAAGGAIGELFTTAPIEQPIAAPFDANDRAYRGDPYRNSRRRPW